MSKKYRCLGGYITSRSDGDRHFISARKLAALYRVNPDECIFIDPNDHPDYKQMRGYSYEVINSLIDLWPDESGKYELPQQAKDKS